MQALLAETQGIRRPVPYCDGASPVPLPTSPAAAQPTPDPVQPVPVDEPDAETDPASGREAAIRFEAIIDEFDVRAGDIEQSFERAEVASGDETVTLRAEVYADQAEWADDLATAVEAVVFPTQLQAEVDALIAAAREEARQWRLTAADRELIEDDRIDSALAAADARIAATIRLRGLLGPLAGDG